MIVKIKKDIEFTGIWWHFYSGSDIFFEVGECGDDNYYIVLQGKHKNLVISKSDCEIIEEDDKQLDKTEYEKLKYIAEYNRVELEKCKAKLFETETENEELKKQLSKFKIGQEV